MNVSVDSNALTAELKQLAGFSESAAPAITRIVFSPVDLEARCWFRKLCTDAGLEIREDAVGNLFARWVGAEPQLPPVATGSHIDAIPDSGRYDGTVGVLGGLEAVRSLQRAGFKPRRSVELILFTSEEPTRFGLGCLGSRLLSGVLSPARAALLRGFDGQSLEETRHTAGFKGELDRVPLSSDSFHAFIELHIEQGPLLERERTLIGIVTGIAAPASLRVEVLGSGGHAGAVLMPERRDALAAAAEIILAVESIARHTGSLDSVATTGVCNVSPGAVNSIPGSVRLEVDVRDTDLNRRDDMVDEIQQTCAKISARRLIETAVDILNADAPASCNQHVVQAIERACEATGKSFLPLVSRAYHDTLFMSRLAPVGMIFIPCRNGVSHRPDEYASPADIASGVAVLAHALAELAA